MRMHRHRSSIDRHKRSGSDRCSGKETMAMLADHLIGRTDELSSLAQVLTELDQRRAAAVEFVGEPGIGKTRLLGELAARAEQRGHLVLSGSAAELERHL